MYLFGLSCAISSARLARAVHKLGRGTRNELCSVFLLAKPAKLCGGKVVVMFRLSG